MSDIKIDGESLVRFVYLDESGISVKERITVVAGVIVNADQQFKAVEKYVQELVEEYVPGESREGFAFHGTDLFHGGGKVFDRRHYPRERSHEALNKLLGIPAKFLLPIVYGYHDKPSSGFGEGKRIREVSATHHAFTYSLCVIATERYMRELADQSEVAILVAENNENAHKAIKLTHALLKDKTLITSLVHLSAYLENIGGRYLPIRKIIDTVHFASKGEAALLQIADVCAFMVRCFLERRPGIENFLNVLTNNMPSLLLPTKTGEQDDPAGYKILGFSIPSTNSTSAA